MKRRLSFLIAAIMVLSMLPAMSVSAATSNAVVRTGGTVADNFDWGTDSTGRTPMFRIKTDGDRGAYVEGKIAGLTLTNAEWSWFGSNAVAPADFFDYSGTTGYAQYSGGNAGVLEATASDYILDPVWGDSIKTTAAYEMRFVTKDYAEIYLTDEMAEAIRTAGDNVELVFPLPVAVTGEGAVQVTVSNLNNSPVTEQTYTFANGTSGSTTVTVSDPDKSTSNVLNISTMTIVETSPRTIDLSSFVELTAPAGFKWISAGDIVATGIRGFDNTATTSAEIDSSDNTTLRVYLNGITGSNSIGAIQITNMKLQRTDKIKDTPAGDMRVRVRVPRYSGSTTETVVVGKFSESNITLEVQDKELPKIVSGKYLQHYDDETTKTLDFTITENSSSIWNNNLGAEFVLNDGAKFRALEVISTSGMPNASRDLVYLVSEDQGSSNQTISDFLTLSDDSFTLTPERNNARDNFEIKLRAYVTVKPGYTGEISIATDEDNEAFSSTLHGVIATAIDPFTVTTKSTDVHLGVMNIALGDINIKENVAGALTRTGNADRNLYSKGFADGYEFYIGGASNYARFRDAGKAEVVSGDIVIDDVDLKNTSGNDSRYYDNGVLNLTIKNESTTASEIKLSGMSMDADRNIPAGKLDLRVSGLVTANYHNNDNKDYGSFGVSFLTASPDYVNIVTAPVDQDNKYTTEVSVKIGEKTIVANGVSYTMDAAAFIQDGYTMIPVRAVAVAMGIEDSKVLWDANTKTVTILDTNRGRTSQFAVGSNSVLVSGTPIGFAGPSVTIVDNRAFIPLRALGELVLGCPVSWDSATQTAYFNQATTTATTAAAQ